MNYRTISRIRSIISIAGINAAIIAARGYGVTEPAEFVLWFVATPGQSVKVR